MKYRYTVFSLLFILQGMLTFAQKPFTEGVVVYQVKLVSTDQKMFNGVYTITFKGAEIKKELKLDNGYQDITLLNCGTNVVYSLQNMNGKKYAIQLNMADFVKAQDRFNGFTVKSEEGDNKRIAGYAAHKSSLNYKDSTGAELYYTKEWRPAQAIAFERFPDAKFIPLSYSYTENNGVSMQFDAEKVEPGPVASSRFRIPQDYKMISHEEYTQMGR